jgi:hypothetical protein
MHEATQLWEGWQALVGTFATVFTRPGWVRFMPWVTGMVLCWEEHTLTQIVTALALESRWRVLEHFAEYGAWDRPAVERQTLRLIEQERPARWGCYHPVALDDTKGSPGIPVVASQNSLSRRARPLEILGRPLTRLWPLQELTLCRPGKSGQAQSGN